MYSTNLQAVALSAGASQLSLTSLANVVVNTNGTFNVNGGGATIYSALDQSSGVVLSSGSGAWASVSDRRRKTDFRDLDGESVLNALSTMPIQSWTYKSEGRGIRHVGPTAQDFFAAFRLGTNDTTITTIDEEGISLLAIKTLAQRTEQLKQATQRIDELEQRIAKLEEILRASVKK